MSSATRSKKVREFRERPRTDPYEILGVPRDADLSIIKRAFRKKARQFHPDRNPGDRGAEEQFKLVGEAYETLSDEDRRALFDRFGVDGLRRTVPTPTSPPTPSPSSVVVTVPPKFGGRFRGLGRTLPGIHFSRSRSR